MVVGRVALVVAEGAGVLLAGPAVDFLGAGESGRIHIDDRGVGFAQGFLFLEGGGVDLFGESEAVASGFGEADEFLQPGCAGILYMETGTGAGEGALDAGASKARSWARTDGPRSRLFGSPMGAARHDWCV